MHLSPFAGVARRHGTRARPCVRRSRCSDCHGRLARATHDARRRAPTSKPSCISLDAHAWLEANLANPFRDWDSDDPAFGKAACAGWKKAHTAATRLGTAASDREAQAILKAFVSTLNRLDSKFGIDTVRREEAYEAFADLGRKLGVRDAAATAWFDRWRDF
jgi:hypothetical protein